MDITSCDRVTDLGLIEGLIPNGRKFNKLKHLHLGLLTIDYCHTWVILAIYRLSQQYDELQLLDVSGSGNSVAIQLQMKQFKWFFDIKSNWLTWI